MATREVNRTAIHHVCNAGVGAAPRQRHTRALPLRFRDPCFDKLSMRGLHGTDRKQPRPEHSHPELVEGRRMRRPSRTRVFASPGFDRSALLVTATSFPLLLFLG